MKELKTPEDRVKRENAVFKVTSELDRMIAYREEKIKRMRMVEITEKEFNMPLPELRARLKVKVAKIDRSKLETLQGEIDLLKVAVTAVNQHIS